MSPSHLAVADPAARLQAAAQRVAAAGLDALLVTPGPTCAT